MIFQHANTSPVTRDFGRLRLDDCLRLLRVPSTSFSLAPRRMRSTSSGPSSMIPIFRTLPELRQWRVRARDHRREIGFIPTMGALHQGHLDLVKASMRHHPLTVVSIFVNPMQFAPTEDLSRYPRGLLKDVELLSSLLSARSSGTAASHTSNDAGLRGSDGPRAIQTSVQNETDVSADATEAPLVVFAPTDETMYPLQGELQDLARHRGLNVLLRGYGDVMEGASRPQFFTGVATICTKLFNAVEPEHAYFGQKDIQQALLIRTLLKDLLCSHPSQDNLHIVPTARDPKTGLALSSRNAYLSPDEYAVAPIFAQSLRAAYDQYQKAISSSSASAVTVEDLINTSKAVISQEQQRLQDAASNVSLKMDYVEVFDRDTFEPVRGTIERGRKMVIAGAVWVGKTRILDNILLGWELNPR